MMALMFLWCCVQYFKDTNWKQFTTLCSGSSAICLLCSIFQRYKLKAIHNAKKLKVFGQPAVFNISKIQIESNSQPRVNYIIIHWCCVQYFKDTNWKQFTTFNLKKRKNRCCVQYFKDTNWKQFTTRCSRYECLESCVQYFKDTNWKQFTTEQCFRYLIRLLCSIFQRYKLKIEYWLSYCVFIYKISQSLCYVL